MRRLSTILIILIAAAIPALAQSHDIESLGKWGPYSKEYYGISHINDLSSGEKVEFCLVPGQYRRNFKVPCALYETDVHPWIVSPDMKHICYRQEIEWKDRVYVDASYHILDDGRVLLESHCVNNTAMTQNINLQVAVRKTSEKGGAWDPETLEVSDQAFIVKYPGIDAWYGVAWNYPLSEVRQFRCGNLEQLMPIEAHEHVRQNFKGDQKGHYTANFLRPVTIPAESDTTIWQLLVCGGKDFVESELKAFHSSLPDVPEAASFSGYLPQAGGYALGEQLMEATLLTNVVYPIDAFGSPIRHFCPGKRWNSLYTWDCGFIAWAMADLDPSRGYEIIRQYTTSPEEEAPFVHHGTPLATQILALGDVWAKGGSDEAVLKEIYPRLKRFYDYMSGQDFRKPSGLLATWSIFYNSGGWDDYCPQHWLRPQKELCARTAPMVSTAYYIRCAKILRLAAVHLGLKADVKQYDADIAAMGKGILDNAWDPQAGYFGYVVHDEAGKPLEILRTENGDNFNMGLDGTTPLVAGICSDEQRERLLGHIFTDGELWSGCGIGAVDQKAPYYRIDGYWNGTVWMPHQMILWKTMLDLGLPDRARQIAFKALDKWEQECSDSYNCYEHFMIESGRGGGWFNFSGLSSPVVNWFCTYFKPGTVTTGFNALVTKPVFNDGNTSFEATVEFDKDAAGKPATILVCLSPGHSYKVDTGCCAHKATVSSPYDGLVEISLNASKSPLKIKVSE